MQYGYEVNTYKRIHNTDKKEAQNDRVKQKYIKKMIIRVLMIFFVSRVILINLSAPFGIAILIAAIYNKETKKNFIMGIATLLGYISIMNNISEFKVYIFITFTIIITRLIVKNTFRYKNLIVLFTIILLEKILYKLMFLGIVMSMSIALSLSELIVIIPIYMVMRYSFSCFKLYSSRHIYTGEEQISMAILVSLMISGTWGISAFSISIRNVIFLTIIQVISYVTGTGIGAAVGVTMGLINGMSSNEMSTYISVYGLTGLIPGTFKDAGKWIASISYIMSILVLKLYSNINGSIKLIEILISVIIFLCIPSRAIKDMENHFNKDLKDINQKEDYLNRIKDNMKEKLKELPEALFSIYDILINLTDNKNLEQKNKGNAMVENLAARVCGNCALKSMCWKREMHYTYSSLGELILNYEKKINIIPLELENKCIRLDEMRKQTEQIIDEFIIDEMWMNRLREGRELLASQIGVTAGMLNDIMNKFDLNINFNFELENNVKNILTRNCIDFQDVICTIDREQRNHINVRAKSCHGNDTCYKEILPLIKSIVQNNICVSDDGCRIDASSEICNINFEEMPQLNICTYVARKCKDEESENGDSYFFSKLKYGKYMCIISDGMGSGPEASKESKGVIELIERLTSAEFDTMTILKIVNSVMTLKFSENEKFSTVDLAIIDLFSGELEFAKIGASFSFVKKGKNVYKINSNTLPIGVLEEVDVQVESCKLDGGDIIVMVSDGVTESNKLYDESWIKEFLVNSGETNPKIIAEEIIKKAMSFSDKVNDDMTVMVSKAYKKY